jgi:hypothetical protein
MATRRIYALSLGVVLALSLPVLNAVATTAVPVDSSSALSFNGGGCYSPPIAPTSVFDQLVAVNPEWAPVVNGSSPFSAPVLVHGTAVESHVSQQDFPAAHVTFDQNTEIALDVADRHLLATGNYFGPNLNHGQPTLELEWESGSYPAWAWAGAGDRVVALGRWIFDCGHPDSIPGHKQGTSIPCLTAADAPVGVPCVGAVFNYRSELHPPQAVAVIRKGGAAAVLQEGERTVPVTRADVFVHADGGGSGDACVVTHKTSVPALLGAPCFPLRAPLALLPPGAAPLNSRDFTFDVPLPAVERGRDPILQVLARPTPALGSVPVTAPLRVVPHLDGHNPHYEVTVRMTQAVGGAKPTGFAATLLAGWQRAPKSPVVHLRVTLDGVVVNNALKPTAPGITIPSGWKMQTELNGLWQEIGGLGGVSAASVGQVTPLAASYDLFLPRSQTLDLHVDAASIGCVDTLFGHSLLEDLIRFGFNPADPSTLNGALQLGLLCLNAEERSAGSIDVSFGAPTFGASETMHQVTSTNGAFTLRFRIERVDGDTED